MIHHVKATLRVAFFVIPVFLSCLLAEGNPALPFRALWMVRTSMTSRVEIDRAIRFAARYGFNHLFVQVRGRDDAFYDSRLVPRTDAISDDGLDPLKYAILKGHEMGLKVHAWMNVYLVWSSNANPENRSHILRRYPDWEDERLNGRSTSAPGNSTHRFLSPLHPGVNQYLLMVFKEVLTQYDVDGLHLDYIRYGDSDYGYNGMGRAGFEREYGIDPLVLSRGAEAESADAGKDERRFLWEQWNRYRRDSVTELVRRCNSLILDVNPVCILSAAVKPEPAVAKSRFFQEWDRWLAEGLVDFVVPMNYTPNLTEFARNIDRIHESIPTRYWPGIIMGIAIYNQNALDARDKIRYARIVGFPGISLFSYDSRKNDPEFFLPIAEEIRR
ncbi:MAG: family 10 glycosylhydrolase [Candidatus Neomarinimicrobiota bacterium]